MKSGKISMGSSIYAATAPGMRIFVIFDTRGSRKRRQATRALAIMSDNIPVDLTGFVINVFS